TNTHLVSKIYAAFNGLMATQKKRRKKMISNNPKNDTKKKKFLNLNIRSDLVVEFDSFLFRILNFCLKKNCLFNLNSLRSRVIYPMIYLDGKQGRQDGLIVQIF